MSRTYPSLVASVLLAAALAAQPQPTLPVNLCRGQGSADLAFSQAILGEGLTATLQAAPGATWGWYVDTFWGALNPPICLALSPSLVPVVDGFFGAGPPFPASGTFSLTVPLPPDPALDTLILYSQLFAVDASAPGGLAVSEPASFQFTFHLSELPAQNNLNFSRSFHAVSRLGVRRFLLLTGGGSGQLTSITPTNQTSVFDRYTRTFFDGPQMALPRAVHTGTTLQDGRVLVAGGYPGTLPANADDGEVYDHATGAFTPVLNTMANPRAGHTATLLDDGRVLITGGNQVFMTGPSGGFGPVFSAFPSCDVYDPATNAFAAAASMTEARVAHGAVKLSDGTVLVAGGVSAAGFLGLPVYAQTAERYDPVNDAWSSAGALNQPRALASMQLLPSGKVLLTGGAVTALVATTAGAEVYDPATNAWTPVGSMPSDLALSGSGVLADGSVVVAGGGSGAVAAFGAADWIYRFDETAGWSIYSLLNTPRLGHTFTRLDDGTFLMVGGQNATGLATGDALFWTP